jgi:excinuclease ABC subunit C
MDIKEKIKDLPDSCGVYIMKSETGEVLYIGKAVSIKKRVQSHFRSVDPKTSLFTSKVRDIDYVHCDTEEQALLLEATLIRENKPKYNVELKDNKSYPYVLITDEPYPKVLIRRPTQIKKKGLLLGPYVNVGLLRKALKLIRAIFPYCSCPRPRKNCLYCHLNLCPCPGISDITVSRYKDNIDSICKILSGERRELIEKLQVQMKRLSLQAKFEEAALLRDRLVAVYSLYSGRRQAGELLTLKEALNLPKIPFVIEAIDISSLSGQEAAGSVVVFRDGIPDKNNYRRYRIKEIKGIDDFKMIAEVTRRRYRRQKEEGLNLPDLIIIDGGQAHVNVAKKELEGLSLDIPLIGIAKKNEEVWLPRTERPLALPRDNPALYLIQRIRNEAHRFAHRYHALLREKKVIQEASVATRKK